MDSKRVSPFPYSYQREIKLARSGLFCNTHSMRLLKSGSVFIISGDITSTAYNGIRPTIENIFNGRLIPFGRCKMSKKNSSSLFQMGIPSPPRFNEAFAMCKKCSKNLEAVSCYTGLSDASSVDMRNMFKAYMAIQLVPSDCSMLPPVGKG